MLGDYARRGVGAGFILAAVCSCSGTDSTAPNAGGSSSIGGSPTGGVTSKGSTAEGGSTGGTSSAGGVANTGGSIGTGGAVSTGGAANTGGAIATGGANSTGGAQTGGMRATGGSPATGGATGGAAATGGAGATGGVTSTGGSRLTGGAAGLGGATATGGSRATGGVTNMGGSKSSGGSTGASGSPANSPGCGKTPSLTTGKALSISVSGTSRTYNLSVPNNYDNSHPYRLIMSYHWLSGTANNVTDGGLAKPYYGLWDLSAGSTIFVAPQGLNNAWNNSGGADVEFSRQLITLIESEFCIDTSRVFCEGFSMGGSMSYAMACGMGDVVRAVAVHSGGPMSGCAAHSKPVAYFMTHGTQDQTCTYPGYGVPQLQDFAKVNGCTSPSPSLSAANFAAAMPTPTDSTGATPACIDFTGCTAGYPTRACIFVGPHTPSPGGTSGWVPGESWKFLSQF